MSLTLLAAGPSGIGTGTPAGAEASAFLARTSGLNGAHNLAYIALINGLVSDGVWSKLDFLHIYATQDSTTALLNLVSSSYPGTTHGSPTFAADLGYTGATGSTVYIDTGFNPTSASSPKFVQNSAHISAWVVTNIQSTTGPAGAYNNAVNAHTYILPYYTDNKAYFRTNCTASAGGDGFAHTDSRGHFLANRSSSTAIQGYLGGSSVVSNASSASTLLNNNIYTVGTNSGGTPGGTGLQVAMASAGSSMSSTDATNFYNRLRTYMTAVGVP